MSILCSVESTLKAALEAIGDGVLILDASGTVLLANEPWREMWGIPSDWGTAAITEALPQLEPSIMGDESYGLLEMESGRLVERFHTPLLHHGGTEGTILVFRDVTDRIQTDSELREANRALDTIMCGYRNVWHSVATVLRRMIVTQETLRAYYKSDEQMDWEFHDAVQLISRHAGVERSRRDRVDLRSRATEVEAYAARIGRSAGVAVETSMPDELWITSDADLFVSGVLAAFLGFVLAVDRTRERMSLVIDRQGDGPVRIAVSPGLPQSAFDRLRDDASGKAGSLHASLLRAFAVMLGLEVSVAAESNQRTTVVEVKGL